MMMSFQVFGRYVVYYLYIVKIVVVAALRCGVQFLVVMLGDENDPRTCGTNGEGMTISAVVDFTATA